jgi:hypothetical protein
MTAGIEVARHAEAPGTVISRGPGQPPPRTASRQRDAILIVILLAAIGGLVRDNLVIPRVLTWYFGPAPAWYIRRRKPALSASANARRAHRLGTFVPPRNPSATVRERWIVSRTRTWTDRVHLPRTAGIARLACTDGCWTPPGTRLAARADPCCAPPAWSPPADVRGPFDARAATTGTDWAAYTRERPGMSAFALQDGVTYHTYSAYARGLDVP